MLAARRQLAEGSLAEGTPAADSIPAGIGTAVERGASPPRAICHLVSEVYWRSNPAFWRLARFISLQEYIYNVNYALKFGAFCSKESSKPRFICVIQHPP